MIITPFNVCKFKFIGLFNHIIWLQYIQEQSRQTLLPGLKLFYEGTCFYAALLCVVSYFLPKYASFMLSSLSSSMPVPVMVTLPVWRT